MTYNPSLSGMRCNGVCRTPTSNPCNKVAQAPDLQATLTTLPLTPVNSICLDARSVYGAFKRYFAR